jgi:PAS domain S-box-containing protein
VNPIFPADVVSFLGFGGALVLIARGVRPDLPRECRLLLGVGLGIYTFVGFSNVLQSASATEALDVYEDYAELLFIPFFAYFVYSYGAAQETVRREATEAALRASQAQYRTLVDNVDLGISLIDSSYRVVMANAVQIRLLGRTKGSLAGKECFRSFERRDGVCPHCPGRRAMETGTPQTEVIDHRKEDGSPLTVRVQAFPIPVPGGGAAGFIEVTEDVTERTRAERALQEAEDRLRQIVEVAFEGLAVSEQGRFVEVNEGFASAFGCRPAELVGSEILERVAPECREDVAEKIRAGHDRPYESCCLRRDGTPFPVEVCGRATTYQGRPARVTALRDLTERKNAEKARRRLERQLQETQKLESLGVLAGGIAHDFNNILMGLMGNADLALLRLPPESPVRENVQRVLALAERAAELTRQMLAYSGKGQYLLCAVDLSDLVRDCAQLLAASVSKKADLRLETADHGPRILADASQLRQVVMNLVTNASEALGEGQGTITVTTGEAQADRSYLARARLGEGLEPGSYAFLEVTDTGCGMDEETRSHLFDPFYSTKFTGRGLGLAAVLGITRAHHGAILVTSQPGRGTAVRVLFPPGKPATAGEERTRAASLPRGEAAAVLVVDDESEVREVGRIALETAGYRVLTAVDGQDAVDVFRAHQADIGAIILDATMPRLSGAEALQEIRVLRPDVPVLLSSGYREADARERFGGVGIQGFLQKPYRTSVLVEKVGAVLAPSRSRT